MSVSREARWSLAYLAMLAIMTAVVLAKPIYNWDLLGYMGAVSALSNPDPAAVHATVYSQARRKLPSADFRRLTAGPYRRAMARDSSDFSQQLPFYRVRPLFIGLAALLHSAGISVLNSIYEISALSYLGLGLIVFLWLSRYGGAQRAALLAFLLIATPPVFAVGRLATADALSAAILVLSLYALLELRAPGAFLGLLVLSLYARSDNIVFALMLLCAMAFGRGPARLPLSPIIAGLAACGLSYLAIAAWSHNYGWSTLFYHTFIHQLATPATAAVRIPAKAYLSILLRKLMAIQNSHLVVFSLIGTFGFLANGAARSYRRLLVISAATVVLRYILFPVLVDRFLVPYYLFAAITLAVSLGAGPPARATAAGEGARTNETMACSTARS
ncbi:MAG: hypothetical protein ACYCPX_12525 [Acidiferrobacteraceae bacterium]